MADDDEDLNLFRRAMRDTGVVRQNYHSNRINLRTKAPSPGKVMHSAAYGNRSDDDASTDLQELSDHPLPASLKVAIDETDGVVEIRFARAGIDKRRWRQLKRGELAIEQSIDLHGMRRAEASRALAEFMHESLDYGLLCIEIVHGKGLRSDQHGGVLKPLTLQFLKQQPAVLAFASAPPNQGGTGATLVLLRRCR